MNELRKIIKHHAGKYPEMQPCDAVKLIFQNEFGGGHLISDKSQSLAYLFHEYVSIPQKKDIPICEDIGNGIVRVNMASLDTYDLRIEDLNEIFVLSSCNIKGTEESFLQKLKILKEETGRGIFRFSLNELEQYLDEYLSSGIRPVSHSNEYKKAYNPAYRVVLKNLLICHLWL
jgi:hypothetical protein